MGREGSNRVHLCQVVGCFTGKVGKAGKVGKVGKVGLKAFERLWGWNHPGLHLRGVSSLHTGAIQALLGAQPEAQLVQVRQVHKVQVRQVQVNKVRQVHKVQCNTFFNRWKP